MGKGQGPDWERSSAAWVSAGVRTARTSQGVTRGPATRAETLTCTEWTGPLGLKQRRHQVNFCRIQKPPCQASEELPLPQEQKVSAAALAEGPARRPASTRPMPHSDRCQCRWASAPPLPPPLRELSLPTLTARHPPPPPGNHLQESPSPESSPGVCCTEGGGEACPVTLTLGAGAVEVRPGNISEAAGCGPGRPGWGTGPPLPRGVWDLRPVHGLPEPPPPPVTGRRAPVHGGSSAGSGTWECSASWFKGSLEGTQTCQNHSF